MSLPNKLKLKVFKVPNKATQLDMLIPMNTDQYFIYQIQITNGKAYIFFEDRIM